MPRAASEAIDERPPTVASTATTAPKVTQPSTSLRLTARASTRSVPSAASTANAKEKT